eukprot:9492596-Pyramimonas_sp.AAC.1
MRAGGGPQTRCPWPVHRLQQGHHVGVALALVEEEEGDDVRAVHVPILRRARVAGVRHVPDQGQEGQVPGDGPSQAPVAGGAEGGEQPRELASRGAQGARARQRDAAAAAGKTSHHQPGGGAAHGGNAPRGAGAAGP